jgi:adenylate cyclase
MIDPPVTPNGVEAAARERLMSNDRVRRLRHFWRMLPGSPRCKLCTAPFGAPTGPLLRLIGKGRWPGNPNYCRWCFRDIYNHRGGAEVECSLFFADVRDSTGVAETMTASAFRALLDRFYAAAAQVLVDHEGIVDKFVGDEVVGIFIPAFTGGQHARRAIDAALALLRATGHGGEAGQEPWVPIGIGVNTGSAWVGAVGTAEHVEFTALGDTVNVAARLASAAGSGELLVATSSADAAGIAADDLERRQLDLRGKSSATDVLVLSVNPGRAAMTPLP